MVSMLSSALPTPPSGIKKAAVETHGGSVHYLLLYIIGAILKKRTAKGERWYNKYNIKKSNGYLLKGIRERVELISRLSKEHSIKLLCKVLKVASLFRLLNVYKKTPPERCFYNDKIVYSSSLKRTRI